MAWTSLAVLGSWLKSLEPALPLIAGLLSFVILFGCALACWLSPSEKTDCLFHRHVM